MEELLGTIASQRNSWSSNVFDQNILPQDLKRKTCQEIDEVKIIPAKMIFSDAYDGKKFDQSLTIINCGKYPALVRILSPSSKAFKLKAVPKGRYLPSGLSITRNISYTHTSAMAIPRACLRIYVNEKPLICQIEVYLISPYISLKPKILDFGEIDVGCASEQLTFQIHNLGHKVAQFAMDLGRNDLELIVQPMKGTIKPSEIIEVKVEVLGSEVGSFNKEFWIKTDPPQRVNITGIFIPPKLVVKHPPSNFGLVLIDFPRTYYGAKSIRTLVMNNNSSSASMYCVVAECGADLTFVRIARKTNDQLKSFFIDPAEGRLRARQNYILTFSFLPKKVKNYNQRYYIAFVRIQKVHYRDGIVVEKDIEVKTFPPAVDLGQYASGSLESIHKSSAGDAKARSLAHYIRVCLYGEIEESSVLIIPESFNINYLKVNETYTHEINIRNGSMRLPIIFKYNKVACIEMEPKQYLLAPGASVEISIKITPTRMGEVQHNIVFDLIYPGEGKYYNVGTAYLPVTYSASMTGQKIEPKFNMGISPKITHEVGYLVDDVRFNDTTNKPIQALVDKRYKCFFKNNDQLIAFPNDRPQSLRPWRNPIPCRTIFANMPRLVNDIDEYMLTSTEVELRADNRDMYSSYIKTEFKKRMIKGAAKRVSSDYDITSGKKVLMENMPYTNFVVKSQPESDLSFAHIPLPPNKLISVIISPKYIELGKIAPYTTCTDFFAINNQNEFSINVSIKALSNTVVIKEKKRMVIGPKETKNIFFDCYSHGLGKYYVPVFVIINNCHIFDTTVFATVVPTTVYCPSKEIIIDPKTHKSFFEIYNPVNCEIDFSFEIQDKNFVIFPETGTIPPRKGLFCNIQFFPQLEAIFKSEIYLISQSGAKQIIKVICENEKASIGFHTNVVTFGNIPLNTEVVKGLVLRNFSDETITFLVSEPNPLPEIHITPTDGKIHAKADVLFEVIGLFTTVVEFSCHVKFILQDQYSYTIEIEGTVVFPCIIFEPHFIQIHKIVAGAYQRRVFRVTNVSEAQLRINFPLDDYTEFSVTDLKKNIVTDPISLESMESAELFLEFKPSEPVAYSIYLPFVINDMIGPPALNDKQSVCPETYFKVTEHPCKTEVVLPEILSTLNIRCAAGAPWLSFSPLELYFLNVDDSCSKQFTITNISNTEQHISVPLIDADVPFTCTLEKDTDYEITEKYCKVRIETEGSVVFTVEFTSQEIGDFELELPIYVDKFMETCPFNFLRLFGSCPQPTITCEESVLYFQTITVKEKVSKKITLQCLTHCKLCKINYAVFHEALFIRMLERKPLNRFDSKIDVLVTFDPKEECLVDSEVVFACSCDASFTLVVRTTADNCILGSYESFYKNKAVILGKDYHSTFPFFPNASDDSFYAQNLRIILEFIKRWLYTQGYFHKMFCRIPEGLARFPVDIQPRGDHSKKKKVKSSNVLPLVQLLTNLVDSSLIKHFDDGSMKQTYEDVGGVVYVYTLYRNIIDFLRTQNIFVPQLKPEYLLPYKKYLTCRERLLCDEITSSKLLSENDFTLLSKQCWLDLILRIYKVFVFNRTISPMTPRFRPKSPPKRVVYQGEFLQYIEDNRAEMTDINPHKAKLLLWIEFHFEKQKHLLNIDEPELLKPRKIRSFDSDLWDSLPFATLMIAYCPYMIKYFENFYPNYKNSEQIFHNACMIYEMWKKLNFSYDLQPKKIVNPSATEMTILAAYLYDVLPSFYPTETITLTASLGEEAMNEIKLRNNGRHVIAYVPIFFANFTNDFQVDQESIVIPPKEVRSIKIIYKAKNVVKKSAVLVLSGETVGYKYAKSMAVNLIGIPKIFDFTEEFKLTTGLYKAETQNIDVTSPFENSYQAEVYLYITNKEESPESVDEFISAESIAVQGVPRQARITHNCFFKTGRSAVFTLNLCFVTCGFYNHFVYFLNDEIGDFCIKITINCIPTEDSIVDVPVYLPRYFSPKSVCTCNGGEGVKSKCPKIILADISCKHKPLIEGLRLMIQNCSDENEFQFWNSILDHARGVIVFRNYLEKTFNNLLIPFQNILSQQVTYQVDIGKSNNFTVPPYLTIKNTTSKDSIKLPIHWNSDSDPGEIMINLIAEHGQEVRQYRLSFVPSS